MKTIIKEYNIYNIDELSETAREKAFNDYKTNDATIELNNDIFNENTKEFLNDTFKNSSVKLEYSLSYCQGDGLNIYGVFSLVDLLNVIKDKFSEKEYKTLLFYFNNSTDIQLKSDLHYSFCLWDIQYKYDIYYHVLDCISDYRGINDKLPLITRFCDEISDYMCDLCTEYKTAGYSEIYSENLTINVFIEICESMDYEFLETGDKY